MSKVFNLIEHYIQLFLLHNGESLEAALSKFLPFQDYIYIASLGILCWVGVMIVASWLRQFFGLFRSTKSKKEKSKSSVRKKKVPTLGDLIDDVSDQQVNTDKTEVLSPADLKALRQKFQA